MIYKAIFIMISLIKVRLFNFNHNSFQIKRNPACVEII